MPTGRLIILLRRSKKNIDIKGKPLRGTNSPGDELDLVTYRVLRGLGQVDVHFLDHFGNEQRCRVCQIVFRKVGTPSYDAATLVAQCDFQRRVSLLELRAVYQVHRYTERSGSFRVRVDAGANQVNEIERTAWWNRA